MDIINDFRGEYRWLSNFADGNVTMSDGLTYFSRENAFQAYKCENIKDRNQFIDISPAYAKNFGRRIKLRKDWEQIKDGIMYEVCSQYFKQHPDMMLKLKETGSCELVEGNTWGDTYWGVCNGVGENNLGKILMAIRSEN